MPSPDKIAERLPEREELARRLDALTEELAVTRNRLQGVSAQVGRRATRRGRGRLYATRAAFWQARAMATRLPGPGEVVTQARTTARTTGRRLRPTGRPQASRSWQVWVAALAGLAAAGGALAALKRRRGTATESEPSGTEPAGQAEETEAEGTGTTGGASSASQEQKGGSDGHGSSNHLASDHPVRPRQ